MSNPRCLALALFALALGAAPAAYCAAPPVAAGPAVPGAQAAPLEAELVTRFGEPQRAQIHRGITQVAALWRPEDGDAAAFAAFVRDNYAGDAKARDALFDRYQHNLEMII